jgi:uncharacterized surface protein with fasciclin (FAS1) repeats
LEGDDRFKILFKLVNFTEAITHALNDTETENTFFATPDKFLRPPKKDRKHHWHPHHDLDEDEMVEEYFNQVTSQPDDLSMFSTLEALVDSVSGDKDEKRRRALKAIVTAILSYNLVPAAFTSTQLGSNSTYPTFLIPRDGAFAKQNLRLRVASKPRAVGPPSISINFLSKVIFSDVIAENGIVHVLNHPLLPPPSAFATLFLLPDIFSTFTSAVQRVSLTGALDWWWDNANKKLEGSRAVTVFAPTNGAFKRLPKKLKLWLFSPFGESALKKLLEYHIAPGFIFHTNWQYNATAAEHGFHLKSSDFYEVYESGYQAYENGGAYAFAHHKLEDKIKSHMCACKHALRPFSVEMFPFPPPRHDHPNHPPHAPIPHPKPIYTFSQNLTTLLASNATLHLNVAQFPVPYPPIPGRTSTIQTKLFINGPRGAEAVAADIPTKNGAIHVISNLLIPPFAHKGPHKEPKEGDEEWLVRGVVEEEDAWAGWEEWLPRWANED